MAELRDARKRVWYMAVDLTDPKKKHYHRVEGNFYGWVTKNNCLYGEVTRDYHGSTCLVSIDRLNFIH